MKATLLFLLLACQFIAVSQRHHFVSYSVKEGLAQSQVRDIVQTKDGYLWIATIGGVSRFDGNNFVTYNKANGLLNNVITSILETKDGDLLIACQGGLVAIHDQKIDRYPFPEEFNQVIVFDMIEHNDSIFLATNGSGLLSWKLGEINQKVFDKSKENFIRALEVRDQRLLLGTQAGVIEYTNSKVLKLLGDVSVNEIVVHDESLWILTTKKGVYQITKGDTIHISIEDGLNSAFQKDICFDRDNNAWFISKNGISKMNFGDHSIESVRSTDVNYMDNLKVIYSDSEYNIWVGTSGSGVLKFTGDYATIYTGADGLSSDQIMSIEQSSDNSLWYATYGAGIIRSHGEAMETINYTDGLLNNTVWSLEKDDDKLWIGTSDGAAIYENGNVRAFEYNDSLPFLRVSTIFKDNQSNIWFGTRDGLIRYKDGFLNTPQELINIGLEEVKSFCQIDDVIWISSRTGAHTYNVETEEIVNINKTYNLEENYVSSISKDLKRNIWLGTDEGVYRYDSETKEIDHYTVSKKPSANIVNFLEHDAHSSLWIGTDNGLFSLNTSMIDLQDSLVIKSYNEHDGVVSQECNQNAAFCDNNGAMWFGLNGALIKVEPQKIPRQSLNKYGAVLNDFQINFESVNPQEFQSNSEDLPAFPYANNRFTFRFSAIQFTNPEKVTYSYRLLGSDDDWSPPTRENAVTYARLSPGEYKFETRVWLENAQAGEVISLLSFRILPPFYLTWWFIMLAIAASALMVYLITWLVRRQRERKQAFQDIQNRAKILGLEQQNLNAHMNRHFIFNALNSIQYYINTQEKKLANMYLTKFASLVRKNLDSAQSDAISLYDEIERLKLYMNLEQMRFKDRFDYEIRMEEELNSENIFIPSMLLQPFVENSIMHGILPLEKKGTVTIEVNRMDDELSMKISDNGIGIETSVKQKNGTSYHVSNGMKITRQRMEVLKSMTQKNYQVLGPKEIIKADGTVLGTVVEIQIPIQYRKF